MADEYLAFARQAGYRKVVLWTQSELDAARYLYAAVGFRKTGASAHDSFGKTGLVVETWELML